MHSNFLDVEYAITCMTKLGYYCFENSYICQYIIILIDTSQTHKDRAEVSSSQPTLPTTPVAGERT